MPPADPHGKAGLGQMVTWCHVLLGWAPGRCPGGLSAVTRPGLGLLTYYELGTFPGCLRGCGAPREGHEGRWHTPAPQTSAP